MRNNDTRRLSASLDLRGVLWQQWHRVPRLGDIQQRGCFVVDVTEHVLGPCWDVGGCGGLAKAESRVLAGPGRRGSSPHCNADVALSTASSSHVKASLWLTCQDHNSETLPTLHQAPHGRAAKLSFLCRKTRFFVKLTGIWRWCLYGTFTSVLLSFHVMEAHEKPTVLKQKVTVRRIGLVDLRVCHAPQTLRNGHL